MRRVTISPHWVSNVGQWGVVNARYTVDELNSYLGLAKHFVLPRNYAAIEQIQRVLFRVCSELASTSPGSLQVINETDLQWVEERIVALEKIIHLSGFVIPGLTIPSGYLDVCRTIARRAERRIISFSRSTAVSPTLLRFVNRLSDYVYLIARDEETERKGAPQPVKSSPTS